MAGEGYAFCFDWEVRLMVWLQGHLGDAALTAVSQLSVFGEQLLLIVILGFLYWCYDKKFGKYVGLGLLVANVWNPMLKNVFLRRRPYFDHPDIQILRVVEPEADIYDIAAQGYSFPSGHSMNAAEMYGGLALALRKGWMSILAVVLTVLVGFSRVVVGAHFPTDVLVGWLLGLLVALLLPVLERKIPNKAVRYTILLVTAIPGLFYCKSADYFTGLGLLIGFIAGESFEDKYVQFENTREPLKMILRVLGGLLVYLVLNTLLKLPFSKEFLEGGSYAAMLVRTVRYAIIAFVDFGIYPMLFKLAGKRK